MSQLNPFQFGDPVEGEYYLPRSELTNSVKLFLENRIHVVLIGPRRFGKTSFVLNLLETLKKEGFTCLFIDIFNITSHKDFLQQILRALRSKKTLMKEFVDMLSSLRPKVSAELDPHTGSLSFAFALDTSSEGDIKELIQDVLESLENLGKKVIVAIDEFQKISEIDDQGWLEATVRTYMQQLKNSSFLFTGSRKSLIYDMLNNQNRPLYRSCQPIEFPSLGTEFTDWIVKRFADKGIICEKEVITHLRSLVHDTPNYVQMVCFHLIASGKKSLSYSEVEETVKTIVRQNAYAYQTLLTSLTLTQQRALRLAACEGTTLFAKELLVKYEISSAPALASAIKSLRDKGILEEHGPSRGSAIFDDPLFALWLQISFGNPLK